MFFFYKRKLTEWFRNESIIIEQFNFGRCTVPYVIVKYLLAYIKVDFSSTFIPNITATSNFGSVRRTWPDDPNSPF